MFTEAKPIGTWRKLGKTKLAVSPDANLQVLISCYEIPFMPLPPPPLTFHSRNGLCIQPKTDIQNISSGVNCIKCQWDLFVYLRSLPLWGSTIQWPQCFSHLLSYFRSKFLVLKKIKRRITLLNVGLIRSFWFIYTYTASPTPTKKIHPPPLLPAFIAHPEPLMMLCRPRTCVMHGEQF